jgi:hypothetical protein
VFRPRHGVALALTALAYSLCHHVGSLPDGLGGAGRGTRVADTGGEFTWAGLALAVVAVGWGVRHRRDQGVLLAVAGVGGVVAVVVSALVR